MMTKKYFLLTMFTLVFVYLLACELKLYVRTADTRANHFSFQVSEDSDFGSAAKIQSVKVCGETQEDVYWEMTAAQYIPLSTIIYGETPEGFETRTTARPLTAGQSLQILVRGLGGHGYLQTQLIQSNKSPSTTSF